MSSWFIFVNGEKITRKMQADAAQGSIGHGNNVVPRCSDSHIPPPQRCQSRWHCLKANFINNLLLYLTLFGAVCGILIGTVIRLTLTEPSENVKTWLGLPGDLFMRMLEMTIVPLIMTSMICGVSSLQTKASGKLGTVALAYFMLNNMLGSFIGVTLAVLVKPGKYGGTVMHAPDLQSSLTTQDIFLDLLRNMIPNNIVRATTSQEVTSYTSNTVMRTVNSSEGVVNISEIIKTRTIGYRHSPNIIGVVVCSILIGLASNTLKDKATAFLKCTEAFFEVLSVILHWFLWCTPVGVASMIASSTIAAIHQGEHFVQMSYFVLTMLIGTALHTWVIMPLALFIISRRNPFKVYIALAKSYLIGFSTTSAAAALPDILKGLETLQINRHVSLLVAPLGVPMNLCGSALFISGGSIFLAQVSDISLSTGQIILVGILTMLLTLGLPPVPSASIVVLAIIVTSLGLPANAIATLFSMEWFLDRLRGSSNTIGIGICVVLVQDTCTKELCSWDDGVNDNHESRDSNMATPETSPADLSIDIHL